MTEAELIKYKSLVAKRKLTQQNYNIKCLLDNDIYIVDGIQELSMQIRKIGVSINQVVHLADQNNYRNGDEVKI